MDTVLPLASAAFIPFIPNDVLRNTALAIAVLTLVGHLLHRTSPKRQIDALDKVVQNVEEIFDMATKECSTDPRFIHTTGLKLAEIKYAVSSLRTKTIDGENISWKEYYQYRRGLARLVKQCRGELQDLQSSMLITLECARRDKYKEDINSRKATLNRMFVDEAGMRMRFIMARDEVEQV
ncbi:hypothetical protein FB45DRAFT_1059345 [Roridomyces roridus]|uniref:Uncharacterized protein n=1 Tax=Roridomyces roridus TaxID=1738132 RepID=A0AAD7BRT5_9AGAR|nr:hypothetical protein FB45DRAFT_1059345 [Roridomyces roridus]